VAFHKLCESDPLLDFIRTTYQAVPIRMPDPRWKPLTLFAVVDKEVRYLGDAPAVVAGAATAPAVTSAKLPDVARERSSQFEWRAAVSLLVPFLGAILPIGLGDIEASFDVRRHRKTAVRISLGATTRRFVAPIMAASWLGRDDVTLPRTLDLTHDGEALPVYLVDSILQAKELSIASESDAAAELTTAVHASLAGKLDPSALLLSRSRLVISGKQAAPFALTCVPIRADGAGRIVEVGLAATGPRAAASGTTHLTALSHTALGAANELVQFDDER
jgi:hypothetical protein